MLSLEARIFKENLSKTINKNPLEMVEKSSFNPDKKDQEIFANDFVVSKEVTPNGTKYQRVYKKGFLKTGRVIYYLHGGAYIFGLFPYYLKHSVNFNKAAEGCEIIFLDYKLAPEHKYPCQLNEAIDLWEDLINRQKYKAENIIIGGDSAGGNLTLSLLLNLRDKNKEMPKAGFCMSAWTDMTGEGESYKRNFNKDIMFGRKDVQFTPEVKEMVINSDIYSFVGDADRYHSYVSPVYGSYHNFPPMFFTVGGDEMLYSDTITVVNKLKESKVWVDCDIQPEMFHIYTLLGNFMKESAISYNKLLNFIKEQFNK